MTHEALVDVVRSEEPAQRPLCERSGAHWWGTRGWWGSWGCPKARWAWVSAPGWASATASVWSGRSTDLSCPARQTARCRSSSSRPGRNTRMSATRQRSPHGTAEHDSCAGLRGCFTCRAADGTEPLDYAVTGHLLWTKTSVDLHKGLTLVPDTNCWQAKVMVKS